VASASASTFSTGPLNLDANDSFGSEESSVKSQFVGAKPESSGEENDECLLKIHTKVYAFRTVEKKVGSQLPSDEEHKEKESGEKEGSVKEPSTSTSTSTETTNQGDVVYEQKFLDIGSGDLKINKTVIDGKVSGRLVLRAEKTQRLVLNARIFKEMTFNIQNEKFVRFSSFDLNNKLTVFLLKFKTKIDASEVHEKIKHVVDALSK